MSADFAWEALLLDALGVEDLDHASGPSDLLPLVRWAAEDAKRYRNALASILRVIEAVPAEDWEGGQEDDHPLWRALDKIDALALRASANPPHPVDCRCKACVAAMRPLPDEPVHASWEEQQAWRAGIWKDPAYEPDENVGPCAVCGHDPACGFASVDGDWLCHDDDHSCYFGRGFDLAADDYRSEP